MIGNFFGLGTEQSRDKHFRVEADHPKVFASEDHAPTPQEQKFIDTELGGGARTYKRGRGCAHCNGSGFRGRMGVYEMLEMTPRLVEGIARDDVPGFVRAAAEDMSGRSFVHHAAALAAAGRTTLNEVMRISQSEE